MGRGYWIGAIVGFIISLAVAYGVVAVFDLQTPWTLLTGFSCGLFFVALGMSIGSALDD